MFENLIKKTQKAVDALGVDVKVGEIHCEDTGRVYLAGTFTQRLKFKGMDELFVNETTLTEEIFGMDEDMTFKLFMGYFTTNRRAHMLATDEEVMAFDGHPDEFPVPTTFIVPKDKL